MSIDAGALRGLPHTGRSARDVPVEDFEGAIQIQKRKPSNQSRPILPEILVGPQEDLILVEPAGFHQVLHVMLYALAFYALSAHLDPIHGNHPDRLSGLHLPPQWNTLFSSYLILVNRLPQSRRSRNSFEILLNSVGV